MFIENTNINLHYRRSNLVDFFLKVDGIYLFYLHLYAVIIQMTNSPQNSVNCAIDL